MGTPASTPPRSWSWDENTRSKSLSQCVPHSRHVTCGQIGRSGTACLSSSGHGKVIRDRPLPVPWPYSQGAVGGKTGVSLWLPKKLWQPRACPGAFAEPPSPPWSERGQLGEGSMPRCRSTARSRGRCQAPPGSGLGSTPHTHPVCPEPRVHWKPTHACEVHLGPCKTKAPIPTL